MNRHAAVQFLVAVVVALPLGAGSGQAAAAGAEIATAAEPPVAPAPFEWLSLPRRIPRSWSAARDTPALALTIAPRPARTAAAELALATIPFRDFTLRTGFAGLLELESDRAIDGFAEATPWAPAAALWRGSYAYYVAVAPDALGGRLCGGDRRRCAAELTLQYRHESQHYTGSNRGDQPAMDVSDQPYVGDDLILDVALLQRTAGESWMFVERAIGFAFIPGRSSYRGGPGLDLHARFTGWRRVQPFVSLYGEYWFGGELQARRYPDAFLARALAGVALPSALGDTMIYVSADVGHRKGVRGLTEEATLGAGIRLAFGAPGGPNGR